MTYIPEIKIILRILSGYFELILDSHVDRKSAKLQELEYIKFKQINCHLFTLKCQKLICVILC